MFGSTQHLQEELAWLSSRPKRLAHQHGHALAKEFETAPPERRRQLFNAAWAQAEVANLVGYERLTKQPDCARMHNHTKREDLAKNRGVQRGRTSCTPSSTTQACSGAPTTIGLCFPWGAVKAYPLYRTWPTAWIRTLATRRAASTASGWAGVSAGGRQP